MAKIISGVREVMNMETQSGQMSVNEILKHLGRHRDFGTSKLTKDELVDCLEYYKKLQVIYVDQDENLVFL